MSDILVQASFNSGEWSPQLFARVDLQKYRSGAALLQNFFVDYRGGASTRAGTQYIIQCLPGINRLIPFQAAFNVGYELLFSNNAIRFIFQGSPVLENSFSIAGATQANPAVLTIPGNNYVINDWIYVQNVVGMTQLNGRFFIVTNVTGSAVTIADLFSVPVNSTGYTAYASGGITQRIYTIPSPYAAADLELLKFTQNTNFMIITHPNYSTRQLTLISAIDWTINPIVVGSTIPAPVFTNALTTLPAQDIYTTPPSPGQTHYSYVVTTIDALGQESVASAPAYLPPIGSGIAYVDLRTYGGSNTVIWGAVPGAVAYNVYEAEPSYFGVQPPNVFY